MDAPPIQYARTADGVNLAYWDAGEGPPLVVLPMVFTGTHVTELAVPPLRSWYEDLRQQLRVIRYDAAGVGMSGGDYSHLPLEETAAHLDCILDAAGVPRVGLLGLSRSGPLAAYYAATRPHRVARVAFHCTSATQGDLVRGIVDDELLAIREKAPILLRLMFANSLVGWSHGNLAYALAQAWHPNSHLQPLTPGVAAANDATPHLSAVQADALVIHRSEHVLLGVPVAQALAGGLPRAQLIVLPGDSAYPSLDEPDATPLLTEFFRETRHAAATAATAAAIRTLLFTDLESSTALTQRLGDEQAQQVVRGHNDSVRAALAVHGGEEVKHTGDGMMAAFGSAVSAVEAALQIQRDLTGAEVRVRVGLNAGEPIHEEDDYFGSAVQLAARVCDRAEPGQVVVTQVVRDLVRGKGFHFDDLGAVTLKGFPEPERLFVVGEGA